MKHIKKFNEEIGDPSIIGMTNPDKEGRKFPVRTTQTKNVKKDIYTREEVVEKMELMMNHFTHSFKDFKWLHQWIDENI